MKVILSGKGGSGKSTVSVLLAKALTQHGFRVLLVDADESNMGLHRLLGVTAPQVIMDQLGGKKGFKQRPKDPLSGQRLPVFKQGTPWDGLGEDCVREKDGVYLASVGKIHEAGEGCACPMGTLSKQLFSSIHMGENDIVLIDTAAGIEHFGRGVGTHANMIVGVLDPSYESVLLSEKMQSMAQNKQIPIRFVLNKCTEESERLIRKTLNGRNVVATIAHHDEVFLAGLEGRALTVKDSGVDILCQDIISAIKDGAP